MVRRALLLCAFCALAWAQGGDDLASRVEKLERLLQEEREKGTAREDRIRDLEGALQKATDALARSYDRRAIQEEIDAYLAAKPEITTGGGGGDGWSSRLSIGGVLVMSARFTDIDGARSNTFQVEERYLRFVYRFSEQWTARYYTDGSLAELEWHVSDLIQFNAGQVIVPFGQFNPRSFPDTFDTLSRPLLYLGDEDTFATPANNPRAVFRSIYTDTGVVASGNWWNEGNQLYYAAFVTNGLVGVDDLAGGAGFSDNNNNKQIGARVAYTMSFETSRLGFGASWMTGKYDTANRLSYRMYGADFIFVLDGLFGGDGSLTLRGEYVFAPREINPPTTTDPSARLNEANRTQGGYLLVELRLDRRWMVYTQADWMQQRAPLLTGGMIDPSATGDVKTTNYRFSIGGVYKLELGIIFKLEYAFWDFDLGASDAHRFAGQIVVPF